MSDNVVQPYQNNASANNLAGAGRIFRGAVLNPGSAVPTLTVYDNTSGSGTIVCQLVGAANGQSVTSMEFRIPLTKGLSTVLTGTGASYMLFYE